MMRWPSLERLLETDPADGGCAHAMNVLHVYAELLLTDPGATAVRYPEVVAHVRACGPCAEDLDGLLRAVEPDADLTALLTEERP